MIFLGFGFGYILVYGYIVLYNLRTSGGQLGLRKSRETRLRAAGECPSTPVAPRERGGAWQRPEWIFGISPK